LPKNIKSQLEAHALNVENELKEEDPVQVLEQAQTVPEDQETNLNQSD
jgi:hypothetical protein